MLRGSGSLPGGRGGTGDSGFDASLLRAVTTGTQLAVVDARRNGSAEHASFEEIRCFVGSTEGVEFLGSEAEGCCKVAIIGYGTAAEAPSPADGIPASAVLRVGTRVELRTESTCQPCEVACASEG
ncbi:unnamed protein product [Prorocentrum cordatum]|uniref:Subtilisin n=1 Tax=Prorocentrum cordatum TaxID=2364126 RepID=A0ABN9QZQ3_9DINO|nr:unnamed protein product [Polarella glacialis]